MDKSIHMEIYKKMIGLLRLERETKGMTQSQLASLLGVNQAIVSKIEMCERRIDIIELRTICNAIGIPFIDFVSKIEKQ